MSNESRKIRVQVDILNMEELRLIDSMPDRDAIFRIWIGLLCLAGKADKDGALVLSEGIPYDEEMLAAVLSRNVTQVKLALQTFEKLKMIRVEEGGRIS